MSNYTDNIKILDAVSTTTTSGAIDVSLRKLKSLQFTNTLSVAGSVAFTGKVSNDGLFWVSYNRFISNATTDAKVASISLTSLTTSGVLFIPEDDYFRYIKITATCTSTGGSIVSSQIGGWTVTLQATS
jgi:hypothetical protein